MADIHGICSEKFSRVREVFGRHLDTGADVGASAAVFIDGEPIVDIWGGYFDEARTRPWERNTIVNNFSTTKTMTALSALILADRGVIDFHAPVAKYWPEFAAEGKGEIQVRLRPPWLLGMGTPAQRKHCVGISNTLFTLQGHSAKRHDAVLPLPAGLSGFGQAPYLRKPSCLR